MKAANFALKTLLDTDNVDAPCNLMRLAGTVNHPSDDKRGRGYVLELVTLHIGKMLQPIASSSWLHPGADAGLGHRREFGRVVARQRRLASPSPAATALGSRPPMPK